MLTIRQTTFTGIDGLERSDQPQPTVTDQGVLIKMHVLPVVPTDWKRELNPQATVEQAASLPRIIGIGGVGQVVAVGQDRDATLLHQRVLVMHPAGSYAHYLVSENPDFIFPLPDTVSDSDAAALTAGPSTAKRLLAAIQQSTASNIVITGANAVIGLYLLQMLKHADRRVWPIVSATSQSYFHQRLPNVTSYTIAELPTRTEETLIIDIAGSPALLAEIATHFSQSRIVSIALTQKPDTTPFKFVHETFNPADYRQFVTDLATGHLVAPIDRIFPVTAIKQAQHYAQDSHSRGRVLVTF